MAGDNPYNYGDVLTAVPGSQDMSRLSDLAHELLKRKKALSLAESILKAAQESLAEVEERQLPDEMGNLGLAAYTTRDRLTITVSTTVRASASAKKDPERFSQLVKWLDTNGHGGLTKNEITVLVGRGQDEVCKQAIELLRAKGLQPTQETSIHASTLSAFVRERLEACEEIPEDLFGIYRQTIAKVSV